MKTINELVTGTDNTIRTYENIPIVSVVTIYDKILRQTQRSFIVRQNV